MSLCGNVSIKISTKVIYLLSTSEIHYSSLEGKAWRMNFPPHSISLPICCCLEAVQYTVLRGAVHPKCTKKGKIERCCERGDWTDFTPELSTPFSVARNQKILNICKCYCSYSTPHWLLKPTRPLLPSLKQSKVAYPGVGAAACAIPRSYGRITPGSRIHHVFNCVHFNASQAQPAPAQCNLLLVYALNFTSLPLCQ